MTSHDPVPSVPVFQDPSQTQLLRKDLEAAGFTAQLVLEKIRLKEAHQIASDDLPLLLARTRGGDPLDTAIRLFLMSVPVDSSALSRLFPSIDLGTLVQSGLISLNGTAAQATIRIFPFQQFLVAFDCLDRLRSSGAPDYVMGISGSSLTLAHATVRTRVRRTLDLGTGCGIQALLAAAHSDQVVALDRNPRALHFARLNAALSDISNIEFRAGDLFEPVEGETFDLIVSNPPFVISPEVRYIYRDGGMRGDQICRKIVSEAPRFLSERGFCQLLCNWVEPGEQNWGDGVREWFAGTGCDAWVIRSHSQDADTYAAKWIRHTELREPESWIPRVEEWRSYYQDEGIERIGAGLITIRRCCGLSSWVRVDEVPPDIVGPCGESIRHRFEVRDWLETIKTDSEFLQQCFRVSPEARLQSRSAPTPDGWQTESATLELTKGLSYSGKVDVAIANLVVGCNGESSLDELLNRMVEAAGVGREKIEGPVCSVVRDLVERGFLLPAEK